MVLRNLAQNQKLKNKKRLEVHVNLGKRGKPWLNSFYFLKRLNSLDKKDKVDVLLEENISGIVSFISARILEDKKRKPFISENIGHSAILKFMHSSLNQAMKNSKKVTNKDEILFYGMLYLALKGKRSKLVVHDIIPKSREEGFDVFRRDYSFISLKEKCLFSFHNSISFDDYLDYYNILNSLYSLIQVISDLKIPLLKENLGKENSILLSDSLSYPFIKQFDKELEYEVVSIENPLVIFPNSSAPLFDLYEHLLFDSLFSKHYKLNGEDKLYINPYEQKIIKLLHLSQSLNVKTKNTIVLLNNLFVEYNNELLTILECNNLVLLPLDETLSFLKERIIQSEGSLRALNILNRELIKTIDSSL